MEQRRQELQTFVDKRLQVLCQGEGLPWLSMSYSLEAGGKRLRPVLCLMAAELLQGDIEEVLDVACAIEMIHTYSLIHDDLPAMDNDTLRRGKPTNHVVFGEAQAILAGDGLLNYAFEVMLDNAMRHPANLAAHVRAMGIVAKAAGPSGMIAGQVQDMAEEGRSLSLEELEGVHALKTGRLITGALLSGLELFGPTESQRQALKTYGNCIGLAFQIVDDILDVTAGEELGKTAGKDVRAGKTTYVTLFGVQRSYDRARELTNKAQQALTPFGERGDHLCRLAGAMLARKK